MTTPEPTEATREALHRALAAHADKVGGHTEYDAMLFEAGWNARGEDSGLRAAALQVIADVEADPYTTPDISALQAAIDRGSDPDADDK